MSTHAFAAFYKIAQAGGGSQGQCGLLVCNMVLCGDVVIVVVLVVVVVVVVVRCYCCAVLLFLFLFLLF
jgi:hypothetical protein